MAGIRSVQKCVFQVVRRGNSRVIPPRRSPKLRQKTEERCPLATQNPGITTVSGPKDLGCGGFDWKVWFDIPNAAGKDGWIIQEVTASFDAVNPDGSSNFKKTYHFWEAWEVKSGKKVTVWQDQAKDDNDDQYFTSSRPDTKGTIKVVGKAKFIEGPLPADFKTNNPDTVAGILHSTTKNQTVGMVAAQITTLKVPGIALGLPNLPKSQAKLATRKLSLQSKS